jgi:hypothetical protein
VEPSKKNADTENEANQRKWSIQFFGNHIWVGFFLVLFSVILDLQYQNIGLAFSTLVNFINAVGIAILVASVFTFAMGTDEFTKKISHLLENIVLSRKFLENIGPESKREALKALIRPSEQEQLNYSNLDDYYEMYIKKTLSIRDKCVRSNYQVCCKVWYDNKSDRIMVEDTATYRMYPTKRGFSDIAMQIYGCSDDTPPVCRHLIIKTPNGSTTKYAPWNLKQACVDDMIEYSAFQSVKEIGAGCSHLDVEIRTENSEYDHWAAIGFQAKQPTDGFRHHIICGPGVYIHSVHTFSEVPKMDVDRISDSELIVRCTQWLDEGSGLSVVLSRTKAKEADVSNMIKSAEPNKMLPECV